MRLVVMGVSGCGKSSLGAVLAQHLALPFTDADDLHPDENRAKMARGQPLNDEDRWPWLQLVGTTLAARGGVLACSALRRSYRDRLRQLAGPLRFVHLVVAPEILAARLAHRSGHFMPAALLDSQLAALEPLAPGEGLVLDASGPMADTLRRLVQALASSD